MKHKPSNCPLRDKDEYTFGCTSCLPTTKNKKQYCLRCGFEKGSERTNGCYLYGDKMAKRHLYK